MGTQLNQSLYPGGWNVWNDPHPMASPGTRLGFTSSELYGPRGGAGVVLEENSGCWARMGVPRHKQMKQYAPTAGCGDAPTRWFSKCFVDVLHALPMKAGMGFLPSVHFPCNPSNCALFAIDIRIPPKTVFRAKIRGLLLQSGGGEGMKHHCFLIPPPHFRRDGDSERLDFSSCLIGQN